MNKHLNLLVLILLIPFLGYSQIITPTKWNCSINDAGEIVFAATVEKGWHLYDTDLPAGGPTPTTFNFEKVVGAEMKGKPATKTELHTEYDELYFMDVSWYKSDPTFTIKINVTDAENFLVEGYIDYLACNDERCNPGKEEFSFSKKDLPANLLTKAKPTTAKTETVAEPKEETTQTEVTTSDEQTIPTEEPAQTTTIESYIGTDIWKPVIKELEDFGNAENTSDKSLLMIFLLCFGGGFLALLTPCVWPIIPMTVSFFLKRSKKSRKKAIQDAAIYGLSIIVIFLVLGLVVTGIFGASALNELSTSALFNLIFFALLLVFAISFLGAFELTLPASWTNKMDKKAETTTGLLSIFFMAFTLVLVSFSCTGPIIGALLVQAASMGNSIAPAVGMFGFGLALAIPFAFFAIFPSLLNDLPKSGGWLNTVKVVLGFLELALALKFLSVADLAYGWRILDREVFLVLWIVIFAALGFYLLGKIKFPHDSDLKHVSIPRFFMAVASFAFAIYMVPGLWGAPLKAISAFPPPLYTQDFNLYSGGTHPQFHDYEEGMAYAAKHKKPVLVDFTGYGCVNCREMEASVWSDNQVKSMIDNDYVLISLYVDDKTKLDETIELEENGKTVKLRTVGDKWGYLQKIKFGAVAQPYYVLLDNNGMPLAPWRAYDKDVNAYIDFLKTGLSNYKK
ncbi:thioredoxin family protein [Bacteroidales bacterium OttesenSCG-928-I14]|nr:thioredoxin family protein [Bacteroidales bacterium OttesenSCG-928-I14]